ncbi:hypothetical protein Dimus_032599 [Dionaea muscipula]
MSSFKMWCHGLQRRLLSLSSFHPALLFSTETSRTTRGRKKAKTALSMADYLVNSLGFSLEQAISASTRARKLKSKKNANSVIGFLKKFGFDKTQIHRTIFHYPLLLNRDVDKTITPKIRAFQDLGLSGSFVINLIASSPKIMRMNLESFILPKVELLKSILGPGENVEKAIKSSAWLLSGNPQKMQQNVILLQKYGLSSERIQKLVVLNPKCLLYRPELLQGSLVKVEELMGIKPKSAMFIHAIPLMLMCGEEALRSKYDVFKSYGWTDTDIAILAKRHPLVFRFSGNALRSKLNFIMKELRYGPEYILQHHCLLTLSLQNRIMPRAAVFHVLKETKLLKTGSSLYTVLCFNETRFLSELVMPYKELLPVMYDAYLNKRIGSLTESENYGQPHGSEDDRRLSLPRLVLEIEATSE